MKSNHLIMPRQITAANVSAFAVFLRTGEREESTIEKHLRNVNKFAAYLNGEVVTPHNLRHLFATFFKTIGVLSNWQTCWDTRASRRREST